MRTVLALAVLLLLSSPAVTSSARADWQYTRWGMSPEEVIKASNGSARPTSTAEQAERKRGNREAMASAEYRAGEVPFRADFLFAGGKLVMVALHLLDHQRRNEVLNALSSRYGAPVNNYVGNNTAKQGWQASSEGNYVEAYDLYSIRALDVLYTAASAGQGL